jgi:hypothetical protein
MQQIGQPDRHFQEEKMEALRVLSPTAILGYGFPVESFTKGMEKHPHVIAVDAGSTDPGPYYLGAGTSFTDKTAVKRDLQIMISAALSEGIPVIIGSAGGSGGEPHLDWTLKIVREIAEEKGFTFRMAVVLAEIKKDYVVERMKKGEVIPLSPAPDLTENELEQAVRIVGQMGVEPFVKALETGAQVIVAGRAYDPAVFAALPIQKGYDKALAIHMGKILECACIAATPGSGSDCIIGSIQDHSFSVEPLNPGRRCTTLSVAAHTLYEKTDPYLLPGPGGVLNLTETEFIQETDRAVQVRGSRYVSSEPYRVKLEGVTWIGCRTLSIAGIRDPILIRSIDEVLQGVRERVTDNFKHLSIDFYLDFKIYGRDAVMGRLEPLRKTQGHELGIVIEAVAKDQETADTICSFARSTLLHYGYEGRISTAGNLAFPYSPSDLKAGGVYTFSVYHLMDVSDPCELFPMEIEAVGRKERT